MNSLEFVLSFQNNTWFCKNDFIQCKADELHVLDQNLKNELINRGYKGKYLIKFHFDFDVFPIWMRQYMPHYFNRKFIINLTQNNTYESVK